ncbi:MAG TPA: hypothetical protein VGM56_20215 [Byssovorax sp.]
MSMSTRPFAALKARGSGAVVIGLAALALAALTPTDASADAPGPAAAPVLAHARDAVLRLESEGMAIQAELRGARSSHDAERARCLDDALTRMHVATRTARGLRDTIGAAATSGDARSVELNTTRLDHLADRALRLFASAQRCALDQRELSGGPNRTVVRVDEPAGPPGVADFPLSPPPR